MLPLVGALMAGWQLPLGAVDPIDWTGVAEAGPSAAWLADAGMGVGSAAERVDRPAANPAPTPRATRTTETRSVRARTLGVSQLRVMDARRWSGDGRSAGEKGGWLFDMGRVLSGQIEESLNAPGSGTMDSFAGARSSNIRGYNRGVRVLVVEDDALMSGSLARGLVAEGYAVDVAETGLDGLHLARENAYDAMILDVLLPELDGFQVCAKLRAEGADLPVLMLTAKDGTSDVAGGLDSGADDYLVKPFEYPVLLARLRALLRRGPARLPPILTHGQLAMDPGHHRCTLGGVVLELTPREFDLLRYLLSYPSTTHTRWELLEHVWGENDAADFNVVQVYVSALRRKLDRPGRASLIETVRGVGYRLADVT